jgi:hypothetical protein
MFAPAGSGAKIDRERMPRAAPTDDKASRRRQPRQRARRAANAFDRCVDQFLDAALRARAPLIIIATPAHRAGFVARLSEAGHDVRASRRARRLALVDADRLLDKILVYGMPDGERFAAAVDALLDRVSSSGGGSPRVYSEMVDLLWRRGNPDAALMLEELWGYIESTRPLSILRGYYSRH